MESRAGRIDPIEEWRLGEGMRTKMSIKKYVSKGVGGGEWTDQKPSWGAQPSEKLTANLPGNIIQYLL